MNWTVDRPIRAGELVCVPIVETVVSVKGFKGRVAGHGEKRPAMILVFRDSGVTGVDVRGRVHQPDEIERRFPEALARARAQLGESEA